MAVMKTIGCTLVAFTFVFAVASIAHAGDLDRSQKLRISGWTMVGVGAVLVGTGTGLIVSVNCVDPACSDDEMFRQNMGIVTISLGVATAIGAGMPMLIRARKLSHQTTEGREVTVTPGLTGVTISGRF